LFTDFCFNLMLPQVGMKWKVSCSAQIQL
jgi:hypothetical protein